MASVEVLSVSIDRKNIHVANMDKIIGISALPLMNTYVNIEIKGISTAYINAFRRTSIDELAGFSLTVPTDMDWRDTTDRFMLPQFICQRISLIPLKPNLGNDYSSIKFDLIVENMDITPMSIYSKDFKLVAGKLSEPIFNPSFKIGVIQPGHKIAIRNIYISTGIGKDNACYQRVRCAAYKHLDIEQYDTSETHLPTGSQVDNSGYKISSMVANPKHHLYSCIIPATNTDKAEIVSIFVDTCNNIRERLRFILSFIESPMSNEYSGQLIEYSIFQLSEGIYEGILIIKTETHTIGELIKRTIYELIPDIINIKYVVISHEDCLKITIQYKEHVTKILVKALKYCMSTFELLQKQFIKYK